MQVVLAEHAGTCFGVQRALDLAMEVAESGKEAMSFGPLIHNPRVVDEFASKGMLVAKSPDEVRTPVVVIRSHGVLPDVRKELDDRGLEVVDTTCPFVIRAQKKAAALGRSCEGVVIVGEHGHPEVEGLYAWALQENTQVWVVEEGDDLPADMPHRIGVVVQTTQRTGALTSILNSLEAAGHEVILENTICSATTERQESALALSAQVDAMVVLGGRNSSNTTRLFEVCRSKCQKAFHVESPDELRAEDFAGCSVVGVTAGASTPREQIAEIICTLEAF